MSPQDALAYAMSSFVLRDFPKKPGAVVERMPAEVREALKRMTSADALNMRYVK